MFGFFTFLLSPAFAVNEISEKAVELSDSDYQRILSFLCMKQRVLGSRGPGLSHVCCITRTLGTSSSPYETHTCTLFSPGHLAGWCLQEPQENG